MCMPSPEFHEHDHYLLILSYSFIAAITIQFQNQHVKLFLMVCSYIRVFNLI